MSDNLFEYFDDEPTNPQWNGFARRTMQLWGISNGTQDLVSRRERIVELAQLVIQVSAALVAILMCIGLFAIIFALIYALLGM